MIIDNKYYLPSPDDDREIIDQALSTMEAQQKEILDRKRDHWDAQLKSFLEESSRSSQKISACEMFKMVSLISVFSPDFHFAWCPLHESNEDMHHALNERWDDVEMMTPEWIIMGKGEYAKKFL